MSEEAHGSSSRIPRPLRSNTDKSGQTLQEVLLSTAEEKKRRKNTSTSRPDTEEEYSNQEDSDSVFAGDPGSRSDLQPQPAENIKSEGREETEARTRSPTPIHWDKVETDLHFEDEFFTEVICVCQYAPIVYRPTMADSKQDLEDDRSVLSRSIAAISRRLTNHAPPAPAIAVPMTLKEIQLEEEELKSVKLEIDTLMKRTMRLFRGDAADVRDRELGIDEALKAEWKTTALQASEIKESLEANDVSRVKIPKAEPPSFDGQSSNWPAFLDQFNSMVVSSTKISKTDKLVLLKKSLEKGTANSIVQNFALTDIAWDNAWAAVKSRYDHERELAYSHLKKLFDLTSITFASQSSLRNIVDTVNDVTRALKNLNLNVESDAWDLIVIFIIRRNLDTRTRTDFEKTLPDDKFHKLDVLLSYLNTVATALGSSSNQNQRSYQGGSSSSKSSSTQGTQPPNQNQQPAGGQARKTENRIKCAFCSQPHFNSKCQTLTPLSPAQRSKLAMEKKLCKNCLAPCNGNHRAQNCRSAPCGVDGCVEKHHALLHSAPAPAGNAASLSAVGLGLNSKVILSTASVNIIINGQSHMVRAVLDQRSQINMMTEKLANKLQLTRKPAAMVINGVGNTKSNVSRGITTVEIQSTVDLQFKTHLNCYVLPEITGKHPSQKTPDSVKNKFKNLKLADEKFYEPGHVDMLLGLPAFLIVLGNEHIKGQPTALDTKLGYVICGEVGAGDVEDMEDSVSSLSCCVDFDLSRFWKQEEVAEAAKFSTKEKDVEEYYARTHKYLEEEKKFEVSLPFIPDHKPLGESRAQAKRRFLQLEQRLERNPEKKSQYHQAMNDYIESGQLKKTSYEESANSRTEDKFYLPHHFVEKESSSTKLRVVFDGSAKSSSGVSLNDVLQVGPTLQPDLVSILTRFREHKIVFSADIKKMYLQIRVKEEQQGFMRVLWRKNLQDPIEEFKFTCVVFGLASSPYLAVKTLQQLAEYQQQNFPVGAQVLREDFYVDDCLSGGGSVEEAERKQKELTQVLENGGFHLCKFSSNSPELLESIPENERETQLPLELESNEKIKTLGILWDPASDNFTFRVQVPTEEEFTKRMVASYAAKTYDPTGLIQPVIIKAKIILQELWESKVGWDDPIPLKIHEEWKKYLQELSDLEKIKIPRHALPNCPGKVFLHGFADASTKALGAVIYAVGVGEDGKVTSRLLTSKSKVAPLRMVSVPRLELSSAVLLTRLMKNVKNSLRAKIEKIFYWSDSTSVLGQIQRPSRNFKTFVGNRVSYIQEFTETMNWNHVKSEENPADLASRGVYPKDLINNDLWWKGPAWLESSSWPVGNIPPVPAEVDIEEVQESTTSLITTTQRDWVNETLGKFNSLLKLKRFTVFMIRRLDPEMTPKPRGASLMSVQELDLAIKFWVRKIQGQCFEQDIKCLNKRKELPKESRIKSLCPFLDSAGVLRVGGRLQNAEDVPEDVKHPILLPKGNRLSKLIIQETHERNKHAGPQLLTSLITSQFWILGLKCAVRRCIKNCIRCQKTQAEAGQQMMGNLPKSRVTQARAFLHTGVDYAGPIQILPKTGRGQHTMKAWIAVFVCFATKAIHLELVTELSTAAFMLALKRFVARRGKPQIMYSDEGTNFVGAKNEMQAFQEEMESIANHHEVASSLAADGIQWKLNPPGAPHMGGLWEAAVKRMKYHLRRSAQACHFTHEEMGTLLCEIEACLNSRPLTPMSTDPNDFSNLTPGHFLVGEPLFAVPGPDLTPLKINRLDRFQKIQQQMTHFWNRWQQEYLHTLQNRPSWIKTCPNFKVGDLVLIMDESTAPLKWKMGRILEVHPGQDALVRVATVKTASVKIVPMTKGMKPLDKFQLSTSILKRPIQKLVRLPYDDDEERDQ